MTMEELPYKSHVMVPKTIKKKVCSEGMDVVQHTKMMPDCRNVTKQNCISTFTTDEQGEQASDLPLFFFIFHSVEILKGRYPWYPRVLPKKIHGYGLGLSLNSMGIFGLGTQRGS